MGSRITIKDLKNEVEAVNEKLLYQGSNVYFSANERNDLKAVDVHYVNRDGECVCHNYIEAGTPRDCINRLHTEASYHFRYPAWNTDDGVITRKTAKKRLSFVIDFDGDPCKLTQSQLGLLATWAVVTKYTKPVNYSHGYGFFIHLQKRVKL